MLYLVTDVIRTHDEPMYKLDKRAKDLTGMKFNKLTAIYPIGRAPGSRAVLWKCRCECGSEVDIRGDTLQREAKSCGKGACMREHYLDYPKEGDRFGMLTALDYSHSGKTGGGVYWNFRCDCGKEAKIRWNRVRDGERDHCGCQSLKKMVEGHSTYQDRKAAALRDLYFHYRHNAKKRNLIFELTTEQFGLLVSQPCLYCNVEPQNVQVARKRKYLDGDGRLFYNGVDRWDSNHGYTLDNCVPCCTFCNYTKLDKSAESYLQWIQRLKTESPDSVDAWLDKKSQIRSKLLAV